MNLAEIRKKSESVKKSDSVVAFEPAESAKELFEDQPYVPEEEFHEPVSLPGDVSEEVWANCVSGGQVEENEGAAAVPAIGEDLTYPNNPHAQSSPRVKSLGYDPLATIISGREWSAESDESLINAVPAFSGGLEEYLCFKVANEEYAISIMAIKEIIKPREVTEVPRMPGFISGVISLRGLIIPIMDMRLRLALPLGERTGRERVIVVRKDSGFCGVLVDEVIQVAKINKADMEDPPAVLDGIDRDFVKGLGRFDKRMLILLNLETILDISIN